MTFINRIACAFLAALMVVSATLSSHAQNRKISLVRDAEIEALVRSYALPLMKAAGLRAGSVSFNIVNDRSFNAFVSGRGMFVNTGLLLRSEKPGEAIGVIAHEIGHIIGGHQVRLRERMADAMRIARLTTILGIGLGAAGAAAGNSDVGRAGLGVATSGSSIALRGLLRYQRSEESSADRTAVTLLRKTKQSGKGMLTTFRRMGQELAILGGQIDPYTVSHPLPSERLRSLTTLIKESPYYNKEASNALQERHDMARAKIAAYTGGDRYARAVLADKSLSENARLYGRAIVAFLYGSPKQALPLIETLIKRMPRNAYVHEMKGEILLRTAKPAGAVDAFRKAIRYDGGDAGFMRVGLGHALVETRKPANLRDAINELNKALAKDPTAVAAYQHLSRAHAELGNQALSLLANAEFAVRTGKKAQAKSFATRASKGLKRGSPGWLRAQDILNVK